jgi:hypothetical protein
MPLTKSRHAHVWRHRMPQLGSVSWISSARQTSSLSSSCPRATARIARRGRGLCWRPGRRSERLLRAAMQDQRQTSGSLWRMSARRSSWAAAAALRACRGRVAVKEVLGARSWCRWSSSARERFPDLRRHGRAQSTAASVKRKGRDGMHIHALDQNPYPIVGERKGAKARQRQRRRRRWSNLEQPGLPTHTRLPSIRRRVGQ